MTVCGHSALGEEFFFRKRRRRNVRINFGLWVKDDVCIDG